LTDKAAHEHGHAVLRLPVAHCELNPIKLVWASVKGYVTKHNPLSLSEKGNKYILTITDHFTKWVEVFPLHETSSVSLATVLVDEVVSRYGVPTYLHSDQGANLRSEVIKTMDILLGIEGTRTSAYHPQGNGQVERFNRTLEAILAKTVQSNQRNWDTCLPKALFAYRTAIHESTGYTPFHLMFGRSPQLPIDVMLGRVDDQSEAFAAYTPYVQELHEKLRNAYGLVRKSLAAVHAQQKKIYDKKSSESAFKIGDRVWLFVPAVPTRTKKLASLWRGPYTVVDKTGPVNYRVQLIRSTATLVVHRNRLKHCFGDPQQPGNNLSHQSAQANDTGALCPTEMLW